MTDSTAAHSNVMKMTKAPFKTLTFIFKPVHLACPTTAPQRNGNESAMTETLNDKKVLVKVSLGLCVSVHQVFHVAPHERYERNTSVSVRVNHNTYTVFSL